MPNCLVVSWELAEPPWAVAPAMLLAEATVSRPSWLGRLCGAAWLMVVAWTLASTLVHAQLPDVTASGYERLIRDALTEYDTGSFAESRVLFERAHSLKPSARTWRGLGFASFELKDYRRAQKELSLALEDTRQPLTAQQRAEVRALLERTEQYVGELHLQLTPANASVQLDGAPFQSGAAVDLGEHALSVYAPGYQSLNRKVSIEGGGKAQHLTVELVPLDLRPSLTPEDPAHVALAKRAAQTKRDNGSVLGKWWFWGGVGAVAVGGVLAAVLLTRTPDTKSPETGDLGPNGLITALRGTP